MPDKTAAQDVSDVLTETMFRAVKAKGIVVAFADEDGAIHTRASGDFVTKLGLYRALEEKGHECWDDADDLTEEEDKG